MDASRDDGQRTQYDKVNLQCPSQPEILVEASRTDIVRTSSSTEDVDASTVQTPSAPLCADSDRNVAGRHVSVKNVDPDNSEDGIYRSSSGTSLSSARERRRKSKQLKQQGKRSFSGCKMVLKSRSSSDSRKEEQDCMSPASHETATGETPVSASVTKGGESRAVVSGEQASGRIPDIGAEEVDGLGIPRTQSDPPASYRLTNQPGSHNDKRQTPSVSVQPHHLHPSVSGSAGVGGSERHSSSEASDSSDRHGSGNEEGGERGSEELDSMLTILDATLLLPPPEEPRETSPTPPREAF